MLRSFLAIAAGFYAIAICMGGATLLARWLAPGFSAMPPSRPAQAFNLVVSSLLSAEGGHITTRLAPESPLIHSLILAIIVLLVATAAASTLRGLTRGIYPLALAVLPSIATLGGGILTVLYR
jgi:hypothetical protein